MPRLLPILAATVALALCGAVVAGCGSDSSSSDSTSTPAAAPAKTDAAAPAAAGSVAISMKDIAFNPKVASGKVGEKIVWTNDDDVQHNVVADSGADFKSDTFGKGGTFEYTPTKAGDIAYECTLHPGMTGTIKVVG